MPGSGSVVVMPWFNPEYYAYFWVGLQQVFGASSVRIDDAPFPSAKNSEFHRPRDTFAFVVDGRRYFVSANDHAELSEAALDWADVLGTVNVTAATLPTDARAVVVPVGPAFGIRGWTAGQAVQLARRFASFPKPRSVIWRGLLATLRRQSRRAPIQAYRPSLGSAADPVWYVGAHWARHPEAHEERVAFLRAARAELGSDRVRGGLVPVGGPMTDSLLDLATAGVSHQDYLEGIARSPVVFNHPAVHGCVGWKLGEFLALGKPIITTEIDRLLPEPLEHGVHWWVTRPEEAAIAAALRQVLHDEDLRRGLGGAAREFFERVASPAAMIERLIAA